MDDLINSDQSLGQQKIDRAGRLLRCKYKWCRDKQGKSMMTFFIPSTGKWYVEFYVNSRGS